MLVKDGDKALLVKCFAGCDSIDILAELKRLGLLEENDYRVDRHRDHTAREPKHRPDAEALELWRSSGPIREGAPAAKFLLSRGLTIAAPPTLRATTFQHLERFSLPAMIAAVQAPDRQIIAVQKTLIDPRGDRKAQVRSPRLNIGSLGSGAIRLAAATTELGLAEGTEKALAAIQLFGIPCWATLGAARMHHVWVPEGVRDLHVFADNDESGREAAGRVADANRHRRVILRFPPERFKDWDEVTQAESRSTV